MMYIIKGELRFGCFPILALKNGENIHLNTSLQSTIDILEGLGMSSSLCALTNACLDVYDVVSDIAIFGAVDLEFVVLILIGRGSGCVIEQRGYMADVVLLQYAHAAVAEWLLVGLCVPVALYVVVVIESEYASVAYLHGLIAVIEFLLVHIEYTILSPALVCNLLIGNRLGLW